MRINRVITRVIIIRVIIIIIIIRVTQNDGSCWKSANFGASACSCSHSDYDVFPRTHFILIPRDTSLSFHFHASLHSVVFPRIPSPLLTNPILNFCIPFFPRSLFPRSSFNHLLRTFHASLPPPTTTSTQWSFFQSYTHLSSFALVDSTWTELGKSLDSARQTPRSTE